MSKSILSQNIVFIGIDVHKSKYVICALEKEEEHSSHFKTVFSSSKEVINYIEELKTEYGQNATFVCGYEAGPTGIGLKREINQAGGCCSIIPLHYITPFRQNSRIKTDKRDAEAIAQTLKHGAFYEVYTPDEEDEQVKEYLRLRDLKSETVKSIKQRILAFLLRKGQVYSQGTKRAYWTQKHREWIRSLKFEGLDQLTFEELLTDLTVAEQGLDRVDQKIEEISKSEKYWKHVKMLRCFTGFDYLTALCFIVEIGDFERFASPGQLASFLGLVPGEHSTGSKHQKTGMTKAGNKKLRTKAILAAHAQARSDPSRKTKRILEKQEGNTPEMIAYADRCNRRCSEKFKRLVYGHNKPRNIAIGALARELVNFVWGAMTGHIA